MTVQTAETKTHYAGNGLTTEWPVPFPVVQDEHIKLIKVSPLGESEDITTGYTVNGVDSGDVSVTYPTTGEPLAAGWQLTIYREMPLTQTLDLESGGAFDAEVIERQGFDHMVMQIQQVQEQVARALQLAITDVDRTPDEVLGEMFELEEAAQQALTLAQQALQAAQDASQTANGASQATQDALSQVEQALQETAQTVQEAQQALQGMGAVMQEVEALAESLEELGNLGEILQEVQAALAEVQDALAALNSLGTGTATVSGFTPIAPEGWEEGWALALAADGSTTYSAPPEIPASVPIGGIIMWSGSILDIPDRWLLCDGTHGTPNLLDRFVICAGLTYASGDVGGSDTHTYWVSSGDYSDWEHIRHVFDYCANARTYALSANEKHGKRNDGGDSRYILQ